MRQAIGERAPTLRIAELVRPHLMAGNAHANELVQRVFVRGEHMIGLHAERARERACKNARIVRAELARAMKTETLRISPDGASVRAHAAVEARARHGFARIPGSLSELRHASDRDPLAQAF